MAKQCDAYVADNLSRKRDPRFVDADKYKPPKPEPTRFRPSDFSYDPDQLSCTCPAGKSLYRNGANVRIKGQIGIKFTAPKSACGPCHLRERCLRDADQKTPRQVVFFRAPTDQPTTLIDRMTDKIDSPRGRMLYRKRLGTVEPPFGNLRYHKRLEPLTLRSRANVDGQWKLYALVHNIEKLAHYGRTRWQGKETARRPRKAIGAVRSTYHCFKVLRAIRQHIAAERTEEDLELC